MDSQNNNTQLPYYENPPYSQTPPSAPYVPSGMQGYGQPASGGNAPYAPYAPYMPPQKKGLSAGKIIAIILAALVALFVLICVGLYTIFFSASEQTYIDAYETSQSFSDLVDLCDYYDSVLTLKPEKLRDSETAAQYFSLMLDDTKTFIRSYDRDVENKVYDDGKTAYSEYLATYLHLLLQMGRHEDFTQLFVAKLLETDASGNYYTDSYLFIRNIKNEIVTLSDAQKLVVTNAYDALLEASGTPNELYYNLKEYYDCCEAMQLYEKADDLEKRIYQMEGDSTNRLTA